MKAQKGHSTHSTVRGGPGYFPTGYSTGGGNFNVVPNDMSGPGFEGSKVAHFTNSHHKVKKPARVEIFDQDIRPAPGYYKSTLWDGFENGNIPNIDSPLVTENGHIYQFPQDFLHAAGVLDLQHNQASAPHHWLRPNVEEDHSEEMLEDYFEHISSGVLRDKIEILREGGYSEEEIMDVIQKVREADIVRKFNKPESVIRRSAHAFAEVKTPYYTGPPGNRYPNPVEASFLRARGGHFGPYQSRGHVIGDEQPRAPVQESLQTPRKTRFSLSDAMTDLSLQPKQRFSLSEGQEQLRGTDVREDYARAALRRVSERTRQRRTPSRTN